jgi:hypothetical protein
MQSLWEWLKGIVGFVLRNADAFLAMAVALGVIVAEVVGHPPREVVDAAILALLGTTALALLRNRGGHRDLDDLRRLASDAVSERPYIVVWQDNHWDLIDQNNAKVTCTEQIRFTRHEVSENFLWSNGPGTVEHVTAKWRRGRNDRWVAAERIHQFATRGGTKEIFCFNDEHSRGDMLDWCVERDIVGQFPAANESVEIEAATKSNHPRTLRITWPKDIEPTRVEIREGERPARPVKPTTRNGRPYVEEKVSGLKIGEKVRIDWTW